MAKIDNLILKYRVAKRSADGLNRIDPTSNGKYLDWLFKMKFVKKTDKDGNEKFYVSGSFPASLHSEVNKILVWMEKNGNNPKFKTEYKDINFFKTPKSLIDTMGPLCVPSKKEIKDQVTKVLENDKWLLIVPKTFEASQLYGMGTRWCTTQKTYFNQYNRNGFLFYLIDKTHDRKFGIPINFNGNSTRLNKTNLEFYNNEDSSLRFNALANVYGKALDPIWEAMDKHFRDITLLKVRKRVLEQAVNTLKSVKTSFTRDKVYENEEVNKMMTELLNTITSDIK